MKVKKGPKSLVIGAIALFLVGVLLEWLEMGGEAAQPFWWLSAFLAALYAISKVADFKMWVSGITERLKNYMEAHTALARAQTELAKRELGKAESE